MSGAGTLLFVFIIILQILHIRHRDVIVVVFVVVIIEGGVVLE